jgi:hypothetical protein
MKIILIPDLVLNGVAQHINIDLPILPPMNCEIDLMDFISDRKVRKYLKSDDKGMHCRNEIVRGISLSKKDGYLCYYIWLTSDY